MTVRDRIAPWAVAFLVIFLAVYCAVMGERLSHCLQDWWHGQSDARQEEDK